EPAYPALPNGRGSAAARRKTTNPGPNASKESASLSRSSERRVQTIRGALPIIQKEEHRRTLRDGSQQIAELAEGVWADHVTIVRREKETRLPLAGVHGEMVLPKIHHHFVELPLADHSARQLHRLYIANDPLRPTREIPKLRIIRQCLTTCVTLAGDRVAIGPQLHLLASPRLLNLAEGLDELRRLRIQCHIMRREVVCWCVVDAIGREL